nr:MAG: p33 protein [Guiyang tombus-like virus 1]
MSIGILSSADVPVCFGSIDYKDPNIIAALCRPGLKERSTFGGQIVTALKMAIWVLFYPLTWVYACVARVGRLGCRVVRFFADVAICVRRGLENQSSILLELTNKRVKAIAFITFFWAWLAYGITGIIMWNLGVAGLVFCFVPTNARFFLQLKADLNVAWGKALAMDDLVVTDKPQPVKGKNTFACRLAVRAISKVGLLSPTRANALVYQKVILDDMQRLNVRCADRVRVLPLAIAACLRRPDEVEQVESCIKQLYNSSSGF